MNRITSKRSLRRFPLFFLSLGGIFLSYSWAAAADEPYPARPVNIIVGYAPGGVVDTSAKIIGDRLAEVLGQSMLRVHKPGGEEF